MAILDKLKEIPLFSCLSGQELSEVEKITREETFLKNNIIIREADNTTALYVMVSGKAVATGSDEDGKQIIFNVFRKGNYFGEMSFIDKEPRCATVTAGTKIVVLRISGEKLRNILRANPEMMFGLMKGLLEKLRKATSQVTDIALRDVYKRITLLLKRLAKPYGMKQIVEEKLTNTEIGEMIGAGREVVSRIMSKLYKDGFISKENSLLILEEELPDKFSLLNK